jgi:hypothetical protein
MKFLLMIFDDHSEWGKVTPADIERVMQTHAQLQADLRAQGKLLDTNRLRPGDTATTIRVQGGRQVVSDGPFTETKEVLGGFYLIDCASQAEAVEWAKRLPLAERRSSVEVRAIWRD